MRIQKYPETMVSLAIVGLILLMVLPVSSTVLDFLIVLSFMFSIAILLICVSSKRVLDFSVFPSVLLLATLYRLAINVASTRLILANGHTGKNAAGKIIETFGEVVIQGNYFVGIVVFAILNVINFIVITKGAGRVSEVAARFALDSLPGKQAAIESDLRSENISVVDAQRRRDKLDEQADFYGSMDGASKFVRGDAVAGILITFINIIGGLIVGVFQKDLGFAEAAKNYTLMTVGDGLVSQVPALMVSTAAGVIITRAASSKNTLTHEVGLQMKAHKHVLIPLSLILLAVGIFFTEAKLPFFMMAIICFWVGRSKSEEKEEAVDADYALNEEPIGIADRKVSELEYKKEDIENSEWMPKVQNEEDLVVELSASLVSAWTADDSLINMANAVRKQIIGDVGCFVPPIKFVDNIELPTGTARFFVGGKETFSIRLYPQRTLAIKIKNLKEPSLVGIAMESPLLGVRGSWIQGTEKADFSPQEYVFMNSLNVLSSHIEFVLRENLSSFINYSELKIILDIVQREDLELAKYFQSTNNRSILLKTLKELLSEDIKIKEMKRIMGTLKSALEQSEQNQSFSQVYDKVREGISDLVLSCVMEKRGYQTPSFFSEELSEQLAKSESVNDSIVIKVKKEILSKSLLGKGMWVIPSRHRNTLSTLFKGVFPNAVFISDKEFLGAHAAMKSRMEGVVHG